TVATLSAAGIVQGTVQAGDFSSLEIVLIILAIGLGSVSLSHINDSGFWIATKFLGLSVADGLKTWSVMTTVLGFVAMAILGLVWLIIGRRTPGPLPGSRRRSRSAPLVAGRAGTPALPATTTFL